MIDLNDFGTSLNGMVICSGGSSASDFVGSALFGIPFAWQSEIQRWHPPEEFVDIQLRGPYKRWIHTHRFREAPGATLIEDEVQYALPFWPVGELAYPLVRLQLQRIFRYRQQAIRAYFVEDTSQH